MPFRFLIADGRVRPPLMEMLENSRELFPHLDIEYVRYPDDASWSRYFAKMHDALRRVRTPYVMLVDNDDFLACAGIESCMEFLDFAPRLRLLRRRYRRFLRICATQYTVGQTFGTDQQDDLQLCPKLKSGGRPFG